MKKLFVYPVFWESIITAVIVCGLFLAPWDVKRSTPVKIILVFAGAGTAVGVDYASKRIAGYFEKDQENN